MGKSKSPTKGASKEFVSKDGRPGPWKHDGIDAKVSESRFSPAIFVPFGIVLLVFALVAPDTFARTYLWLSGQAHRYEEHDRAVAAKKSRGEDDSGPDLMIGQQALISRLLKLLQEVDGLRGEEHREARRAASGRVETELGEIEAEVDPTSSVGKQHVALIKLVREALDADREGRDMTTEWTDEALAEAHGLTTYATKAYWDKAYANGKYGESFEWYGGWDERDLKNKSLQVLFQSVLAKTARILVLGCGNSNMSAMMYADGYQRIVNTDVAAPVIEQMKERHQHLRGMEWKVMDATALDFPGSAFDAVIEKGFFDALFAGTGERVEPVLAEVQRVLRPDGQLLSVSSVHEDHDRATRLTSLSRGLSCSGFGELRFAAATSVKGHDAARNASGNRSGNIKLLTCRWREEKEL